MRLNKPETSEFGTEKGLLQGQAMKTDGTQENQNSLMTSREKYLKAIFRVRASGCVTSDWLMVRSEGSAPGILCSA